MAPDADSITTDSVAKEIRALFEELLETDEPARERRLHDVELARPAIGAELRRLLAADQRLESARHRPAAMADPSLALLLQTNYLGRQVGPYRITRLLGAGGMGVVFLAERTEGEIVHRAAIKILRGDVLSAGNESRFQRECQALAVLDHPNIARLFDAGRLSEGSPYLVMEYIAGTSITDYCNANALDVRERLQLFREVCAAVADAHRKLIVHRDLKPANILVTAEGRVKLLDFGIAKSLAGVMDGVASDETGTMQRLLSPLHAAPEQISGGPITVGCDVYALGVLLYELLAGVMPFETTGISAAEFEQMMLHTAPLAPSQRVRQLQNNRGSVDQRVSDRKVFSSTVLTNTLRGDLDNIILTCLRKSPGERYATVDQLDADIERYLDGYPVHARHGHSWYRVRKFAGRHRIALGAAGGVAAILIAASIALWSQVVETTRQRDRAQHAMSFLVEAFRAADPEKALGETLTAKQILDQAQHTLDIELADDPNLQAELLARIAEVRIGLSAYKDAAEAASKGLAAIDKAHANPGLQSDLLEIRSRAALELGDYKLAELSIDHALTIAIDLRTRLALENDRTNLMVMQGEVVKLQNQMEHVLHDLLPQLPADDLLRYQTQLEVALGYRALSEYQSAVDLEQQVLSTNPKRLPPEHPSIIRTTMMLAEDLPSLGRYDESIALHRSLQINVGKVYGAKSIMAAGVANGLGNTLHATGKDVEALQSYQSALDIYRREYGERHPKIAKVEFNMGNASQSAGLWEDAERHFLTSIDIARQVWPDSNANIEIFRTAYGTLLDAHGRYNEALPLFETVIHRVDREPEYREGMMFHLAVLGRALARYALKPNPDDRADFVRELEYSKLEGADSAPPADFIQAAKSLGLPIPDAK